VAWLCALGGSSVSLHPGLQGTASSASSSSQENIVAAIVQRAAAEAAARSSRQSSVDVLRPQPLQQLPVSSPGQVSDCLHCLSMSFCVQSAFVFVFCYGGDNLVKDIIVGCRVGRFKSVRFKSLISIAI